jgi:hypothetical protein
MRAAEAAALPEPRDDEVQEVSTLTPISGL